jgi:hypothetical protein
VKIRTAEQLFDFTSKELAWRKKELQSLRAIALDRQSKSPTNKGALLRSMVTMTYAHWEGFIKACAIGYLEYVAMQRLRHNELAPNFLALSIRPILNMAMQSKKHEDHIKLVQFFLEQMDHQSSVPFKDVVNTEANLSSVVLRNIVATLGFDYAEYETKEKLIDEKLLKLRNHIAHGEYLSVDETEVVELQEQCITLMELFRNQVFNAATMQQFRCIIR